MGHCTVSTGQFSGNVSRRNTNSSHRFLNILLLLVQFQHSEESLLRHFHVTDLLHALLTALLLLQQLTLTRHITTIALRRHVLAHLLHRLTGDDLRTDGGLNGDIELLSAMAVMCRVSASCLRSRRQARNGCVRSAMWRCPSRPSSPSLSLISIFGISSLVKPLLSRQTLG